VQIKCKKDVFDDENACKAIFVKDRIYEARIVCDDLLAMDENKEQGLIAVRGMQAELLGMDVSENQWGKWFNEYFEVILD